MHTGCPPPHPPQDFKGWLPQALEMLRFVLVSFSTLFIKKRGNLLVVVFLSISCAFTVCKFVGSLLPLCDLVIHTPSLLPHSSVLYRNIILVKATVHPEVRNLDFSSWPWSLVFIPMLKYYFHKTDFPSLGDYKAMNQIPCYVWSHCGIVLCNNAELNTTRRVKAG